MSKKYKNKILLTKMTVVVTLLEENCLSCMAKKFRFFRQKHQWAFNENGRLIEGLAPELTVPKNIVCCEGMQMELLLLYL